MTTIAGNLRHLQHDLAGAAIGNHVDLSNPH
jgi:hypothetical protein